MVVEGADPNALLMIGIPEDSDKVQSQKVLPQKLRTHTSGTMCSHPKYSVLTPQVLRAHTPSTPYSSLSKYSVLTPIMYTVFTRILQIFHLNLTANTSAI